MQIETAKKGYKTSSQTHIEKHDEMSHHIDVLKKILFDL